MSEESSGGEGDEGTTPDRRAPARAGSWLRVVLLLVVLATVLAAWGWGRYRDALERPLTLPPGRAEITLEVHHGATLRHIAAEVAARGLTGDAWALRVAARIEGKASALKAGEYAIRNGTTLHRLLELLVRGEVVQHPFTIVEGWTFRQLRADIAASKRLVHTLADVDDATLMTRIGYPGVAPEGRFLPETYHFPAGTTDVEFLRRAAHAMSALLASEWSSRAVGLPLETPDQALVLASIIEKETAVATERPRIAGVFVRRLERGMRLETDPSVIYGLGEHFNGNLTRADLHRDTPYNTYTRKGLPPTPIAMPGAASIHAALHPADGDALFFVARGDGTHVFSATYAEHRKAVLEHQIRAKRQ